VVRCAEATRARLVLMTWKIWSMCCGGLQPPDVRRQRVRRGALQQLKPLTSSQHSRLTTGKRRNLRALLPRPSDDVIPCERREVPVNETVTVHLHTGSVTGQGATELLRVLHRHPRTLDVLRKLVDLACELERLLAVHRHVLFLGLGQRLVFTLLDRSEKALVLRPVQFLFVDEPGEANLALRCHHRCHAVPP
jgi:hypothetical protein